MGAGETIPEIAGYRDLARVGSGGFATVYRAFQERFKRTVAVKVLDQTEIDGRVLRNFERECQALGELSWHPHVIAVYDSGATADGRPYLTMEFLEAGSFGGRMAAQGRLPWGEVLTIGVQTASALSEAHRAGTMHRDLKPENLLIGRFGEVKLADFGIAAVNGADQSTTGRGAFTVSHVAPEVLRGVRADAQSDIYGLGSTLFTLASGQPPFIASNGEPIATVMMRILDTPAPRLTSVPADLADLVEEMLAKEPADRPRSADEVGRRCQRIQRDHGLEVTMLPNADGPDSTVGDDEDPVTVVLHDSPGPGVPGRGDPSPTVIHGVSPSAGAATAAGNGPEPEAEAAPEGDLTPAIAAEPSSNRRRWLLAGVGAVVIVIAVALGARLLTSGDDDSAAPGGEGGPERLATIEVGDFPVSVAEGDGGLWVSDRDSNTVSRIEPATNEADPPIPVGENPVGLATGEGGTWVATRDDDSVTRLDATGEIVARITVGDAPDGIAVGEGAVWVSNRDEDTVSRINPNTNEVTDTIEVGAEPYGVAVGEGSVWVTSRQDDQVTRIDPTSRQVTASISVGAFPVAVAVGEGAVWVTNFEDDTVSRIDPGANDVAGTIDVRSQPIAVTVAGGLVWVANHEDDSVDAIDPTNDEVDSRIDTGVGPTAVAGGSGSLWVATGFDDLVTRYQLP